MYLHKKSLPNYFTINTNRSIFITPVSNSAQNFSSKINVTHDHLAKDFFKEFNESAQRTSIPDTPEINSSKQIFRQPSSKYPLENAWSFWFFKSRSLKWSENLILLTTVEYVEDFWSVYNYLKSVEDLANGRDYMLFKKDIKPMWEDPQNVNGGRWQLTLEKFNKTSKGLQNLWQNSLLSLIGSQYDTESSYVNGVVVNIRPKFNKLALWTKHAADRDAQNKIGKRFKKALDIHTTIIFEEHKKDILTDRVDLKQPEDNQSKTFSEIESKEELKTRRINSDSIQNAFDLVYPEKFAERLKITEDK